MNGRIRVIIAPVLALLVVGAVNLASAQPTAALDPSTGLLVPTRGALAVCVDALTPGSSRRPVADMVRATLDEQRANPVFAEAGYDRAPYAVAEGCLARPALLSSGKASDQNGGPYQLFAVRRASPYRAFVFLVSPDDQDRMFGNGLPLHAQESVCLDKACYEVTSALYVTQQQLGSPRFTELLQMAIGLKAPEPNVYIPGTR